MIKTNDLIYYAHLFIGFCGRYSLDRYNSSAWIRIRVDSMNTHQIVCTVDVQVLAPFLSKFGAMSRALRPPGGVLFLKSCCTRWGYDILSVGTYLQRPAEGSRWYVKFCYRSHIIYHNATLMPVFECNGPRWEFDMKKTLPCSTILLILGASAKQKGSVNNLVGVLESILRSPVFFLEISRTSQVKNSQTIAEMPVTTRLRASDFCFTDVLGRSPQNLFIFVVKIYILIGSKYPTNISVKFKHKITAGGS